MINNEAFVGPANLWPVGVLWGWSSSHTAQIILKGKVFLFFFPSFLLQIRNLSTLFCGKVLCILLTGSKDQGGVSKLVLQDFGDKDGL